MQLPLHSSLDEVNRGLVLLLLGKILGRGDEMLGIDKSHVPGGKTHDPEDVLSAQIIPGF